MKMNFKKNSIVLCVFVALGVVIYATSISNSSLENSKDNSTKIYSEDENDKLSVEPAIVSTDANGEMKMEQRGEQSINLEELAEKIAYLEENINYRVYEGNEAKEYYTDKYAKKVAEEKNKHVEEIKKNKVDKFVHSFLVMSINYLENEQVIVTCFFADCLNSCKNDTFKIKNGYDEDGFAERVKEYIFTKEDGGYKVNNVMEVEI